MDVLILIGRLLFLGSAFTIDEADDDDRIYALVRGVSAARLPVAVTGVQIGL